MPKFGKNVLPRKLDDLSPFLIPFYIEDSLSFLLVDDCIGVVVADN